MLTQRWSIGRLAFLVLIAVWAAANAQTVITVVDTRGKSTELSNAGVGYFPPGSPTMAYTGSWVVLYGGNRK